MRLISEISMTRQDPSIDYGCKTILLGSCFAEHIAAKLDYFQFRALLNPMGILFHPIAIESFISRVVKQIPFSEQELVFHNELWHCPDAHSSMSQPDKHLLLDALNRALELTQRELESASHLLVTLGTAWAYRSKNTGKLVANCHKIPQKEFTRELLSASAVQQSHEHMVSLVRKINKELIIIFTVSPVRHLKDGIVENSRSKAHLISAVHEAREKLKVFYFPSYELLLDELRDYRFYARDMAHPNDLAIDYIWEKFAATWISPDSLKTMEKVDRIRKGLNHRPFQPDTSQHRKFKNLLEDDIKELQKSYPFMRF